MLTLIIIPCMYVKNKAVDRKYMLTGICGYVIISFMVIFAGQICLLAPFVLM